MNTMLKTLLAMLFMFAPLAMQAREDELAEILVKCLNRERVSPDSIEYNLQLLEQEREGKTGVRRAVYTACLAQLYAMRAYSDVTREWRKRSVELFREALSDPESLYAAPTKDWLPLVERGKDEKIYGSNMLYVIWCAANNWARDSVMTEQQLLDFYSSHGNTKPQEMTDEINRLQALNDTIWKYSPEMRLRMADVYYPGDSLRLDIDTANITRMEWKVRDAKGRLLGVNVLTAPAQPGRYTLEARAWTDVRLNKATRAVKADFVVSRLQALVMDMPGKQQRVTVVDARSGRPIPEAKVVVDKKERKVKVTLDADSCLPEIRCYSNYNYNPPSSKYTNRTAIYTDRAIYRPGQQVQLSAVLYEQKHWDARVRANHRCDVKLLDKKRNVLADTVVVSDEFGVVSASFIIPENVELGWHSISVDGYVQGVRVEEYKRPAFYVELDENNAQCTMHNAQCEWNLNHPVGCNCELCIENCALTVTGRAVNYDGTPLRGGRVTATSHRIRCFWWRGDIGVGGIGTDDTRQLDTVYTDMEGRFSVSVPVNRTVLYKYFPTLSVEVAVLSGQGETQMASTLLRLFDDPPMEPQPAQKKNWCECPVDTFDADVPARIEFRNQPGEQRYIFLTAFAGESVVMDTVIFLQDTLLAMDIPYSPHYADGLRVIATHALDGEVKTSNILLRKRVPEKRLSFHWDTFRDYTSPGATEQWTLRVVDAKGTPVRANVMAGMYDASLDAFAPNRWALSVAMSHSLPYSQLRFGYRYTQHLDQYFDVWTHKIKYPSLSHFNSEYFQVKTPWGYGMFAGSTQPAIVIRGTKQHNARVESTAYMKNATVRSDSALAEEESAEAEGGAEDAAFDAVQLRSDFSETAMFQPHLRTDAEGRVQIAFTVPQSLTTWALNVLAHTGDLNTGVLTEKVVARKVLTTKVNVPRFVRERDKLSFTVSVNNNGDAVQSGKMQVQVFNAENGKTLLKKTVKFRVAQDCDSVYVFSLPISETTKPRNHEITKPRNHETTTLTVKAVAMTDTDSDGEQREIPVLASVVSLTESKALTLEPGQSVQVNIADLFPEGATDRRVIIEKVLDPVQTAIDALPEVATPKNEDALSYASAYYAAEKLGSADTLMFINKLASMQREDGGMPWFCGFHSSPYITREVGYLLARLGADNSVAVKVLNGIKRYLLTELKKDIERRKEYDKDWIARLSDLRTLYVLTKDGKADKEMLSMTKKVLKRLPDDLRQAESEYIAIAMIVKHALKEAVLKDGVQELNIRLQHKDGVYLAYRGGSWPSIDRRLSIHTQVMEAWQIVCPQDTQSLRGMQLWLLNQKRTQGWKTPVDCINAVFALLNAQCTMHNAQCTMHNGASREANCELCIVHCALDNDSLPAVQRDTVDLATTKVLTIAHETTKPRNHETTNTTIWASVHAEYTLPIEDVKSAGMDITIERTFSTEAPRVGDRIKEKMLINAARDYEYLVLSIPRAGAAEPVVRLSGYGWQRGVDYYRQVRDNRTDYFIPSLPHGKYILETEYTVEREGEYSTGVPTIKCCYAEEFRAHGVSNRLEVKSATATARP